MDAFFTSSGLVALGTLTFLEIVLGVDNVIFISILASKLPSPQQGPARRIGMLAAMGIRILLLFSIVWITRLTTPVFFIFEHAISGRDLVLIGGGLFLLAKATIEIHDRLEGEEGNRSSRVRSSFSAIIAQIVLLDIVFSLVWEMHDKLFANQQALDRATFEKHAQELGLNMDKFKADLDGGKYKAVVNGDVQYGNSLGGGMGTPTFFINGRKISGAMPVDSFTAVIDEELKKKGVH